MRSIILGFILCIGSAATADSPEMAQAMERATKRCGGWGYTLCPSSIQLTAVVINEGKTKVDDVLTEVAKRFSHDDRENKYSLRTLEGATLLMSELGMLEKPAASK